MYENYHVNSKGQLDRKCHRDNKDIKVCILCEDNLATDTLLGAVKKVICRGKG